MNYYDAENGSCGCTDSENGYQADYPETTNRRYASWSGAQFLKDNFTSEVQYTADAEQLEEQVKETPQGSDSLVYSRTMSAESGSDSESLYVSAAAVESKNAAMENGAQINWQDDRITAIQPYPGTPLRRGSRGNAVRTMQYDLVNIRRYVYPTLPNLVVDGIFGSATENAVRQYQTIKNFTVDGIIGRLTWNSIAADYGSIPIGNTPVYPGEVLRLGSVGIPVEEMQRRLKQLHIIYTALRDLNVDGLFGGTTEQTVRLFQRQFGLAVDGMIGERTWDKIEAVEEGVRAGRYTQVSTPYPGIPLRIGASGDSVRFVQSYLNLIGTHNAAGFSSVKVDGIFGEATRNIVRQFQRYAGLTVDGIVGSNTWEAMISYYNAALNGSV